MTTKYKVVIFFVVLILPLIIFLRTLTFYSVGGRDAGVYAYIGEMILQGQIPYRDIWDHKTPFIYYLNAILFRLFGANFRTIAFFEIIWLFVTSIFFYKLSQLFFERKISLFISLIFTTYITTVQVAGGSGHTMTYAVLPAIIAIINAVKYKKTFKKTLLFISGIMASFAFLFRQNFAIIAVVIILYLTINYFHKIQTFSNLFLEYLIFVLGNLIPVGIFFIYFLVNGALSDAISQIITYNFYYSRSQISHPLFLIQDLLIKTLAMPLGKWPFLISFGIVGIFYLILDLLKEIKNKVFIININRNSLFIMLISWFLLDVYSISYSKKYFEHYYLEIIPTLSLLSGYTLNYLFRQVRSPIRLISFLTVLFLLSSPLSRDTYDNLGLNKTKDIYLTEHNSVYMQGHKYRCHHPSVVKWIIANTSENDYIYFWGAETAINFFTKRRSPTKYTFLYPLLMPGYVKTSDIERFILDLKERKPKFIIDTIEPRERIPLNLESIKNKNQDDVDKLILPAISFIYNNYCLETTIDGWKIYKQR